MKNGKWKWRSMPAMLMAFGFAVLCLLVSGQTAKAEEQREIKIQYTYVNAAGDNSYYEEVQYMPAGSTWGDFFTSYALAYESGKITDADADNQWQIRVGNILYDSTDAYYSLEIPEKNAYICFYGLPETYKKTYFSFTYYENGELNGAGTGWDIFMPGTYAFGSEEALAFVKRNMFMYDFIAGLCNTEGAVVTVTPRSEGSGIYSDDAYNVEISVTVGEAEEPGNGQNTNRGISTSSNEVLETTVPIGSLVGNNVVVTTPYQSVAAAAGMKEGQVLTMSVAGSVGPDAQTVLTNAVMSTGATLAYVVDVSLNVEEDGIPVGSVHELSSPVTLAVEAPSGIDGNLYDFAVIRIHGDGSVTVLPDLDNDPKTITFATDRFSIFAVVYNTKGSFDVVKDNVPKTGDAFPIAVPVAASVMFVAIVATAFACSKRKNVKM